MRDYEKLLKLKFQYDTSDLNLKSSIKEAKNFDKAIKDSSRSVKGFSKNAKEATERQYVFNNALRKGLKGAITGVAIRQMAKLGKEMLDLADETKRTGRMIEATFEDMSGSVLGFTDNALEQYGLAQNQARNFAGTFGMMFKSIGVGAENTRTMSQELTRLTADMSSFMGVKNDKMFESFQSALAGNIRALRMYGISMTSANLEAYRLAEGIDVAYNQMNEASKMILRYNYMIDATRDAHNDFGNNAYTWANQMAILSAQWQNLKASIGTGLAHLFTPLITMLNYAIAGVQYLLSLLGRLFGITQSVGNQVKSVGTGIADATNDASRGVGRVGKGVKQLKKELKGLMGFDEINKLTATEKSEPGKAGGGGGGGGAVPGGIDANITPKLIGAEKFEGQLKQVEDFVKKWKREIINAFVGLGAYLLSLQLLKIPFVKDFAYLFGKGVIGVVSNTITWFKGIFSGFFGWLSSLTPSKIFNGIIDGFKMVGNGVMNVLGKLTTGIVDFSGNVATALTGLPAKIWTGLKEFSLVEFIKSSFLGLWGFLTEIGGLILQAILSPFTTAWNVFTLSLDLLKSAFVVILDPINIFIGFVVLTAMAISDLWQTNAEFRDNVTKAWNSIKDLINSIYQNIFKPIGTGIKNGLIMIWEMALKPLWEAWKEVIASITGLLTTIWTEIFHPIATYFVETWGKMFGTTLGGLYEAFGVAFGIVGNVLATFLSTISSVIDLATRILKNIVGFVKSVFVGDWSSAFGYVRNIFSDVFGSFGGIASRAWQSVISAFSKGGRVLVGITTGIADTFKSVLRTILNGINNVIAVPFRAIDSVLARIRNTKIAGFRPFSFIPTIPVPQIPIPFADGGIVYGETFAQVGEYEGARRNPEVIAPLDKLSAIINTGTSTQDEMNLLREQNEYLKQIAEKDTTLRVDGKQLNKANRRAEERLARMKGVAY